MLGSDVCHASGTLDQCMQFYTYLLFQFTGLKNNVTLTQSWTFFINILMNTNSYKLTDLLKLHCIQIFTSICKVTIDLNQFYRYKTRTQKKTLPPFYYISATIRTIWLVVRLRLMIINHENHYFTIVHVIHTMTGHCTIFKIRNKTGY